MDYYKFPQVFDKKKLIKDLKKCQTINWPLHFNQNDFTGQWSSFGLRTISGKEDNILATANAAYIDTKTLANCEYFKEIIDSFKCKKEAVRLLSLSPKSFIKEHKDPDGGYQDGFFRIHIPIQTNDDVIFRLNGNILPMEVGECWYADFSLPHFVSNNGYNDRIHLVIDCIRNEWSDEMFKNAGYDFDAEKKSKYDNETKKRIIENLKLLNSDTAKNLISKFNLEIENSKVNILKNWYPTKLDSYEEEASIRWMNLFDTEFKEPFFQETINKCRSIPSNSRNFHSSSTLEGLIELSKDFEYLEPTAFIFHISRCGSTLLSQLLSLDASNIVISEAPIIDDVLRNLTFKNPTISNEVLNDALKSTIKILGQKRSNLETNLFIKLDSWHIFYYEKIRNLFPNTPFIFSFRKPEEVISSQLRAPGMHAAKGVIQPSLFGFDFEEILPLTNEDFVALVIEKYFEKYLEILKVDQNSAFIEYNSNFEEKINTMADYLSLNFSEATLSKMKERMKFHSKSPDKTFEEKTLYPEIKEISKKADKHYQKLKTSLLKDQF